MTQQQEIKKEVKQEAQTGLVMQITGVLSALLPVLGIMGISFDWFNEQFIQSLGIFLMALVTLIFNIYTIIKNHYSGKQAQKQNEVLKENGLK